MSYNVYYVNLRFIMFYHRRRGYEKARPRSGRAPFHVKRLHLHHEPAGILFAIAEGRQADPHAGFV